MKRVDGQKYIKISYPKHKLGDEVVREVAVPATYSEYKMLCLVQEPIEIQLDHALNHVLYDMNCTLKTV